jgi:hypothetical protein
MRNNQCAPRRFVHDAGNPVAAGVPDCKNGLIFVQDAVADEQTQEIALFEGEASLPPDVGPMIVQEDRIARSELSGRTPSAFNDVASVAHDPANEVIGGETEAVALDGVELDDGLRAGFEETSMS